MKNLEQEAYNIVERNTRDGNLDLYEASKDLCIIHDQPLTKEQRKEFQEAFNEALRLICMAVKGEV